VLISLKAQGLSQENRMKAVEELGRDQSLYDPARVMQKPRVGSHPALDDRRDARKCECATADMEWIGDKRAEGYPMHTAPQRPQA
jgi:hypothetical protein